jgi:hypothetical protein
MASFLGTTITNLLGLFEVAGKSKDKSDTKE